MLLASYEWTQWTSLWRCVESRAHFWKHPLFVHIAPPRYKLQSKFSNYIWLHGLMKGYKRLKIPISSGCQAGPGSRLQVEDGSGDGGNGGKVECCLLDDCYLATQAPCWPEFQQLKLVSSECSTWHWNPIQTMRMNTLLICIGFQC